MVSEQQYYSLLQ